MFRLPSSVKNFVFVLLFTLMGTTIISATSVTPIPTSIYPTNMGFTPLRYHCRQETSPEFHPLRPYPASPCDPLIPRKIPRADEDPTRLYLTPYCGKTLNVQGVVMAPDVLNATGGQISEFPANWQDAVLEPPTYYFCRGSNTDICFVRQIDFNVTWDFDRSQFPILGNTQDFLLDVQKVNQYLDWYLNGTVQQSEQLPLDMSNPEDSQRLTTFGGPVKKLLPFEAQVNLKDILVNTNVGTQYHDYDIEDPQWPNTPFSSQEDITAEATVGIYSDNQPVSPEIDGQIVSIGLSIGSADSRLYFPHLRSSNALSDLLSSLMRPFPNQVTSSNPDVVSQVIRVHQGPNPPVPGGADNTNVQIAYEYPSLPGTVTRNTEVRESAAAPAPILSYSELPDPLCDIPTAPIKPGDDLVGRQINGTLTYIQLFRYTPEVIVADSCSGMGSNCRDNCLRAGVTCSTSSSSCCFSTCPPAPDPYCDGPDSPIFPCAGRLQSACVTPCTWEVPTPSCPAWPDTPLDTGARASTFTKTPLVDKIYDTLVVGPQSVLRRFLPQQTGGGEYIEGENDLNNAKEAGTVANYTGDSTDVINPSVNAGNGGSGAIYFPRLESLYRHFLGGNINLNANLQCLLRPYGQCLNTSMACDPAVLDALEADIGGECGICNADAELGPLAQRILTRAGEEFNVPAANIWTAMWHEGGDWPVFEGFKDEDVRKWSLPEWCGGEPMPSCDNSNPATQPPFGWLSVWFYLGDADVGNWSAVQTVDPSRDSKEKVSRCNFMDAAFATAKALRANSAMWADNSCNPPFTFDNVRPPTCSAWTDNKVAQSQRAYGGCALNPDGQTCSRCLYEEAALPYDLTDLVSIYHSKSCN